ncbi:hypothetical protein ASF72_10645 [Arthrobacter sp. Leaf141]|uniref:hypothetical protein n=1 Tax=Arthrobacter sp. Leaf141 TaxID=1736273 RepID=UPI000701DAF6|nr:hypothetical protein [Arthrobacter sp. Leaf141]KQR02484.1 hypothetical protein ASF72_10645 [Arthrobacter sp. Leaf141]
MSTEVTGLNELTKTLQAASSDELLKDVGQVVSKGALNIKQQIQKDFRSSEHFKGIRDIRYNRNVTANAVEAEISPFLENEGIADLVGVAIHGGSRGGGGSVPDPLLALQAEAPRFEEALSKLPGVNLDG